MKHEALFHEIASFCEANRNPELVEKYSRYFKEGYDAYGLQKGLLEEKIQQVIDREQMKLSEYFPLCELLIPESKYELPSAAIWFYIKLKQQYTRESFLAIESWFETGITNWAHCDAVCMELIKLHLRKKIITMEDLAHWRFSPRPFKRRASLVSMIYAMKDGYPAELVLAFTDPLMQDIVRVVHQGAGWLLRETWKKHPALTEAFLFRWKNAAPRLIIQYATEKMSKEEKLRFRKD